MYAPQDRAGDQPAQDREPGRDVGSQDNGARSKTSVATRKKFPAKILGPGQSIFHNYEWEPPKQSDGEGTKIARGRKPYEWTPERSRQLIKLIIHTDLPFDDVTKIMRDADGEGPSESTCRNHWHDIFGYRPDEARLKNPEGREVRRSKLLRAFHRDNSTASPDTHGSEPELVRNVSVDADSSRAESSNASVQYSNGMIDGDSNVAISQADDDMYHGFSYNPQMNLTPPEEQHDFRNVQYGFPSTSHARLPSVVEEGPAGTPDTKREQASPANTFTPTPDSTVAQIEQKEDLPPGFINWFRRTSIGSSFFTEGRHQSVAGSLATSRRRSYQPNRSSIATISQPLSSNAILNILENSDTTTTIQAGHIEKLIDRGADINACNAKGETPLHLAMRLGNIVVFSALLARGANPNARTKAGESIWTYGRNASKQTLDPNKQYVDKDQQRLDTMICAHIEFLKATSQFNRDLVTESKSKKLGSKHNASSAADQKRRRSSATSSSSAAPPVLPWSMTAYGTGSSSKRQKKPRSVDSNPTQQTQGRGSSLGESVQSNETDSSRPSMHKANSSPSPYTDTDTSQHLSTSAPSSDSKRLSWGMSWLSRKSQSGGNPYMSNITTQMPTTQQDSYSLENTSPHTSFVANGFDAQPIASTEAQLQDWHFPDPSALRMQTYYGDTADLVAFPNSLAPTDQNNILYDYSGDITPTQSFILDPTTQLGQQGTAMYGAPPSHPGPDFNDITYTQLSYGQSPPATNAETGNTSIGSAGNALDKASLQPSLMPTMGQEPSWEARYRALEQQMEQQRQQYEQQRQQYEQQRQQYELLQRQLAHQSAWLDSTMYNWDSPAGPAN